MAKKNKSAEFGIYILSVWAMFTIFSFTYFIANKLFNVGSEDQVHSCIEISVLTGVLIPALSFLIGLSSLAFSPKKLSLFLIFASGIITLKNLSKVMNSVLS